MVAQGVRVIKVLRILHTSERTRFGMHIAVLGTTYEGHSIHFVFFVFLASAFVARACQ